jgi:hypothetical protein
MFFLLFFLLRLTPIMVMAVAMACIVLPDGPSLLLGKEAKLTQGLRPYVPQGQGQVRRVYRFLGSGTLQPEM